MPITPAQIHAAQQVQFTAAHDPNPQARLVAGPGTGKSSSIGERVCWLSNNGIAPAQLFVVSFTRASARDLRKKIHTHCQNHGQGTGGPLVSVTTLHSLALRILRAAGQLQAYPADPIVMDDWELKRIFDAEFARHANSTPTRCKNIRIEHEAFWSTAQWASPNYIAPVPPITPGERTAFGAFHGPRSQLYAAVLPGEIVRKCVAAAAAGVLNPAHLIGMTHLIVDEFQDLNPVDQLFIRNLVGAGVITFVAGDDDQSVYSFRCASPAGIQVFAQQYPGATTHVLADCFRCTPFVLNAASALIHQYALPHRVPKALQSLYANAAPPLTGSVHRWFFRSGAAEANAIAESCRDLIQQGVAADRILILMSDSDLLERRLSQALTEAGVAHQLAKDKLLTASDMGRLALVMLRIVCSPNDYVAYRTLLGYMPLVGIGTCNDVALIAINSNLNYQHLFSQPIPPGLFAGRQLTGLNAARAIVAQLANWLPGDTLAQRSVDLGALLGNLLGGTATHDWTTATAHLPGAISLSELRDYLWAPDSERQAEILKDVLTQLGQPLAPALATPPRVRLMTIHGAKGLDGQVVFIPGLEEEVLPGPWRQPYPGLVLEAARLLYVSITRARAACVLTFANDRWVYNRTRRHHPSRFTLVTGGVFQNRTAAAAAHGLTAAECAFIAQECLQL